MAERTVVVKGGGANCYKVSDSGGWFYAYHATGMFGSKTSIGKGKSLDDALALIKSHSGKDIERIS